MQKSKLRALLMAHKIPITTWGETGTKTIADLLSEINNGETILREEKIGGRKRLVRYVRVCGISVYYRNQEMFLRLREAEQVFSGGYRRRRDSSYSVSEKIRARENPRTAARRALSEELGLVGRDVHMVQGSSFKPPPSESESFPGLLRKFTLFSFEAFLSDEQYCPNGYVENGEDKKTYFVWEEALVH